MQNWKYKLAAFMYGRYGTDALYYALFAVWFLLHVLFAFTGEWIFTALSFSVLLFMTYRVFSKNTSRRRKENEAFLKLWRPIAAWWKLGLCRIRDARTAVYRKCPQCKAVLKLPRRRGRHTTNCPRCAHRFDVQVLF
ncbi:MAG: hypothetical protein IKB87_01510 [Clostridia bacterium]|nr:hypothetical protein [Clostridia bacterium]